MTLALILVVLISGCKKNDYQATVGVCPIVVSTIPAPGAVGVPLNQVVSATFNEKMNPSTITGSSFTLMASIPIAGVNTLTAVAGTVVYSGLTAFFTPTNPLLPSTTYTGRVTTAARDLMGNALQADYVWTFATDLPPTVTTDPPNNATGVLLNKVIVATFSVPMDSLTLKTPATNITIKQGTTTVPGKFSYGIKTASFTPTSNLAPFTVYTGTISKGVKNMLGTSMAADYVWSFTTIPQLSLSSMPALGGTTAGEGLFVQGSSVTVVATANAGFTFFNWTDGATEVSTSASYQLTMAGNKTLVANFTPKYVVTVLSNPLLGGTTTVLGGTTPGSGTFNSGTSVTVNAVPSTGFTFTNWTENGTIVPAAPAIYTFTISGDRTLVANYTAIPYTVAVSSNPLLGGTTTVLGGTTPSSGTFNSGTSVTVNAVPSTGFTFTNWTEGLNGPIVLAAPASYTFTITGNRTLVANYTAIPYTVLVSSNPLLGGTTTVLGGTTPSSGTFNSGSLVTVNAVPNVGYRFTNWTEGLVVASTVANYQFTITGNRILVANYTPITFTVSVSSMPALGGVTTGGGTFNSGAFVTVHALENTGYTWANWTAGLIPVSNNRNYGFTITGNRSLVANYTINTYTLDVTATHGTVAKDLPTGPYNYGTTVTLTPTPETGYTFTSWSGDATGSTNPLPVTMNANKNITANFTINTYTLDVIATNGTVVKSPSPDPVTLKYNYGTPVTLTASPLNSGFTAAIPLWSGDASGINPSVTIIMNSDKAVNANFVPIVISSCPTVINLGLAGNYVILAETGISTTGTTDVTGDMGISPYAASFITGFGLILPAGGAYSTSSLVHGKVYAPGYVAPTPDNLTTAITNMTTAYTTAYGKDPTVLPNELLDGNLSGQTLYAGVYRWSSGVTITTGLTLNGGGDPCATFIFQIAGDLVVANDAIITLQNGAHAKNIFWVVAGSKAALGTDVDFSGNILAKALISLNARSKVTGKLLSQTEVTLIANTVTEEP